MAEELKFFHETINFFRKITFMLNDTAVDSLSENVLNKPSEISNIFQI